MRQSDKPAKEVVDDLARRLSRIGAPERPVRRQSTSGGPDRATEHLETCASCQRTLEGLAAGSETWSSMARQRDHDKGDPGVEDPTLQRVMEQARAEGMADETRTVFAPGEALLDDFLSPPTTSGHIGRVGHYEVIEVIGRGGMGVVLKAIDEALHRVVAIKVMAPHLAANGTARRRFIREAQAAAAVVNDHVITIHSVEEADGLPYLVMPLIVGESLQKRLDRRGSAGVAGDPPHRHADRAGLGRRARAGTGPPRHQAVEHPAGERVQRVKITDFGLARAIDDASLTAERRRSRYAPVHGARAGARRCGWTTAQTCSASEAYSTPSAPAGLPSAPAARWPC